MKTYVKRDSRLKCLCCRRFMRRGAATVNTPAKRRPPPHASRCFDCPPDHYGCGCPDSISDWEERLYRERRHEPHCPGREGAPNEN